MSHLLLHPQDAHSICQSTRGFRATCKHAAMEGRKNGGGAHWAHALCSPPKAGSKHMGLGLKPTRSQHSFHPVTFPPPLHSASLFATTLTLGGRQPTLLNPTDPIQQHPSAPPLAGSALRPSGTRRGRTRTFQRSARARELPAAPCSSGSQQASANGGLSRPPEAGSSLPSHGACGGLGSFQKAVNHSVWGPGAGAGSPWFGLGVTALGSRDRCHSGSVSSASRLPSQP